MSVLICLDPGHVRNYNRGAYSKYYEGTKMYDFALMLKEEIDKYDGLKAIITRKNVDDNPSLQERAYMAKNNGCRCFLSLHTNACNTESVNRIVIYRSQAMPKSEDLAWKLMDAIYNTISPDVPTKKDKSILTRLNDRGTDYYGVLRNSTNGSVKESFIIEHVFHTNYKQSEWMYSDTNLRKLAIAEAAALAEYYKAGDKSDTVVKEEAVAKPDSKNYVNYTVKKGDNWWSIAAKHMGSGLKMNELAAYNGKTTSAIIYPGDVLKIPTTGTGTSYKVYTIKKGDSWWKIAKEQMGNGSRYKELAAFNGKSSDDIIYAGNTLKIPQ